ncbi:MAG: hypothetical protein LBG19_12680 [Prevotellaceae bacterium]|jgi:tetratricopeptide (TPR) repeat protein|nr:hypothetical protein [Prevotellaceae bacterium]
MKRVLKYGLTAVAALLLSFNLNAQDINEIIDLFNKANQEFQAKQYDQSMTNVGKAYEMLNTLGDVDGEEAATLKENCEKLLQAIPYMQGKDLLAAKKYDEAAVKLKEAKAASEKFSNQEVVTELNELIPQIGLAKATDFLTADDFQNAAAAYEAVIKDNADNAEVYICLGYAYNKLGDNDKAITNYEKGIELATKANDAKNLDMGKSQLANVYLLKANDALKAKKLADASVNAIKSFDIKESANAARIAGSANVNLKKYDTAINYLEKAASLDKTTNLNTAYQLALSYDAKGNKAKACENYKKIVGNAQFKAYAESRIKALGCN